MGGRGGEGGFGIGISARLLSLLGGCGFFFLLMIHKRFLPFFVDLIGFFRALSEISFPDSREKRI